MANIPASSTVVILNKIYNVSADIVGTGRGILSASVLKLNAATVFIGNGELQVRNYATDVSTLRGKLTVGNDTDGFDILFQGRSTGGTASTAPEVLPATTTALGTVQLATPAQTNAALPTGRAVTVDTLATWDGYVREVTFLFGNPTDILYSLNHNLNTRNVHVTLYEASGNYSEPDVEVWHTNNNQVTILFDVPPGNNSYYAVILGRKPAV